MDCTKLDEYFKNGLIIINPFIYGLDKKIYVRLCRLWIDKLIHCSPNERQLRNIYLEQLCRHSQQKVLGPPFNCPPSEGPLQIIPEQFLIKEGVILDTPPVTSTVTYQNESEMTSWSDLTSCLTSSSYQQDPSSDEVHQPVRKVVSNTSTRTENVVPENRHRIHFKRHYKSPCLTRRKNQCKFKKQTYDSNEDFFKESKENLKIRKTAVLALAAVDKEKLIDKERIFDKEKIIGLEKKVTEIQEENRLLKEQLKEERNRKLKIESLQEPLKDEVLQFKDKLTLIEKMKNALKEEHKQFIDNTLSGLSERVNSAVKKNEKLVESLQLISREKKELSEQILKLKKSYSELILNLKKSHSEAVFSLKNNISDLKKDISKKNKELVRLEKQLQEQCGRMKIEVDNIKQEMENSKELKAKNSAYKSKIIKLTTKIIMLIKHNKKMADRYEQKISVLNKSKDMELWVQKLSIGSSLTNGKKQEMETVISALEEKFRKQLTKATQITLHNIGLSIK